ncbi:hypothetical protein [Ramlibacter sp.]|uniref:hypothetical protein n=1 Tax=Ramlibacter sp. TaxID=1917967 RepID=UPI002622F714|nr:hypothetical protein [Ramlibacter sp.]
MNTLALLQHLPGLLAPALAVALLVALGARVLRPSGAPRPGWWASVAINFAVGAAVLGAGLWHFGRDGKMATYLALVVAVATCQWLLGRGWRR